ncbi:MAG: hypothetical protein IPP67_06760 [Rhodospirillaceae bacterium]|nr:hypothetical protein [Rhodospirillaceae bacterium]
MNAISLLALANQNNVRITAKNGKLIIKGENQAVQIILATLREHKEIILSYLKQYQQETAYRDMYQERAAQYEYEAKMPQNEAERLAYQETLTSFIENIHPLTHAQFEKIIFQPIMH